MTALDPRLDDIFIDALASDEPPRARPTATEARWMAQEIQHYRREGKPRQPEPATDQGPVPRERLEAFLDNRCTLEPGGFACDHGVVSYGQMARRLLLLEPEVERPRGERDAPTVKAVCGERSVPMAEWSHEQLLGAARQAMDDLRDLRDVVRRNAARDGSGEEASQLRAEVHRLLDENRCAMHENGQIRIEVDGHRAAHGKIRDEQRATEATLAKLRDRLPMLEAAHEAMDAGWRCPRKGKWNLHHIDVSRWAVWIEAKTAYRVAQQPDEPDPLPALKEAILSVVAAITACPDNCEPRDLTEADEVVIVENVMQILPAHPEALDAIRREAT